MISTQCFLILYICWFLPCRSLSCQRITLHKNLFFSFVCNSIVTIIHLTAVANNQALVATNPVSKTLWELVGRDMGWGGFWCGKCMSLNKYICKLWVWHAGFSQRYYHHKLCQHKFPKYFHGLSSRPGYEILRLLTHKTIMIEHLLNPIWKAIKATELLHERKKNYVMGTLNYILASDLH